MDERTIHELAVAYAQVELYNMREEGKAHPASDIRGDDEEIYHFVKAYRFALDNIQNAWNNIG